MRRRKKREEGPTQILKRNVANALARPFTELSLA